MDLCETEKTVRGFAMIAILPVLHTGVAGIRHPVRGNHAVSDQRPGFTRKINFITLREMRISGNGGEEIISLTRDTRITILPDHITPYNGRITVES